MKDGMENFTDWFYNDTMQSSDGFIYKKVVVRKIKNGTLYLGFPSGKSCAFLSLSFSLSLSVSNLFSYSLSPPNFLPLSLYVSLPSPRSLFLALSTSFALALAIALSLSLLHYLSLS